MGKIRDIEDYEIFEYCDDKTIAKIKKRAVITRKALKTTRGWTEKLVKIFIPKRSDISTTNPNYASGPPIKLYYLDKIEKIEKTIEFQEAMAQINKKRATLTN